MSDTNERSVASTGSVLASQTDAVVESLRHYVEEREHNTVAIYTPDGRASCGVTVPVHVLEDAMREIASRRVTATVADEVAAAFRERGGPLVPFDPPNPLSLTGLERNAVRKAAHALENADDGWCDAVAATLRGLLERLG